MDGDFFIVFTHIYTNPTELTLLLRSVSAPQPISIKSRSVKGPIHAYRLMEYRFAGRS